MSLSIYLTGSTSEVECICSHCENKHTRADVEEIYSANITHNLNRMADAAGFYKALWRPDEIQISKAYQLIPFLANGIATLESNPDLFKKFDAVNKWGTYEQFLPWLKALLTACQENPNADIGVSR